jgi:hypothetical protein
VTKRCKLIFSITTNFIDEVDLDVIPLDMCGIVLESPYFIVTRKNIICLKMELSTLLEHI